MRLAFLALLACAALLAGCGYSATNQGGSALPEQTRTLFLEGVDNPTTITWLGPRLRATLRDELTRRGWTRWTDRGQAQGLMHVTIHEFTRNTSVSGEERDTLKFATTITLSATITDRDSGEPVWSSGQVAWSDSYYASDASTADAAAQQAMDLAVRRLADLLGQGY